MAASQPLTIMLCWKFTTDYDGTLMATNPDQPILETARESCIKPGHLMNRGKSATVSSNISILDKFLDIQHLFCGADVFATNKKTTTTSDCCLIHLLLSLSKSGNYLVRQQFIKSKPLVQMALGVVLN
ncbi:uncharacterized protein PGTG_08203 [Puccinia graminis f. sp. tritici CRL 75-36-700-3]|uniref:Uncharacterized protein n=1 Tax=Puccinia graminis f. sp. tritici (strain CRL 75-36-700-3 / race SCCL) TaxID=418459 RepID=E3KCK6_PUCGT|nr:uncharacterized protein PGTG_08203 [Puccinia graminis f. sp. tritici CRL 75-36-700-3]EFP81954.1 hypothetical protein PGTG_08203 [Puccinia graminis f. sp. tritici CRL 75-36-700-3]